MYPCNLTSCREHISRNIDRRGIADVSRAAVYGNTQISPRMIFFKIILLIIHLYRYQSTQNVMWGLLNTNNSKNTNSYDHKTIKYITHRKSRATGRQACHLPFRVNMKVVWRGRQDGIPERDSQKLQGIFCKFSRFKWSKVLSGPMGSALRLI